VVYNLTLTSRRPGNEQQRIESIFSHGVIILWALDLCQHYEWTCTRKTCQDNQSNVRNPPVIHPFWQVSDNLWVQTYPSLCGAIDEYPSPS
jgi:hypothetical protein